MTNIVTDLHSLYTTYFGGQYQIKAKKTDDGNTLMGLPISETNNKGIEIFLPITLWVSETEKLLIDCCTIRVTGKKTIIRTAVAERIGTVKEQFNIDDYQFNIKGVLISKGRGFPSDQVLMLKRIYESNKPVQLRNAKAELLLEKTNQVAIESLEFPEVEGKSIRHCPFQLVCESDFIDSLTLA